MQSRAALAGILLMAVAPLAAQVGAHAGGMMSHATSAPAMHQAPPTRNSRSLVSFGRGGEERVGAHRGRFPFRNSILLGDPFWWDDWYPSQPYAPEVVAQPAAPQSPAPAMHWDSVPKSQAPLLIELQGDHYVRVSGEPQPGAGGVSERATESARTVAVPERADAAARAATPLPPTIFVYRDGRREESSDYSIADGVIYARGDYWRDGAWSKQIPVAQLDLPATFQANQQQGVKFVLPRAPNEVVTRP